MPQITTPTVRLLSKAEMQAMQRGKSVPAGCYIKTVSDCEKEEEGNELYALLEKGFIPVYRKFKVRHLEEIKTVVAIPSDTVLVHGAFNAKRENEVRQAGEAMGNVRVVLDRPRFCGTNETRRALATIFALHPKISTYAWEQVIPMVLNVYLAMMCGLGKDQNKVDENQVGDIESMFKISPNRTTIEKMLLTLAAESLMLSVDEMIQAGEVSLAGDKADKTKGFGGCGKLAAYFDESAISPEFPFGEIREFILDADESGDKSKDVAAAFKYSMTKIGAQGKVDCRFLQSTVVVGGQAIPLSKL